MVLGAQPLQVIWLFVRRAFVQLAIGLTIGLGGAFAVGRLLESFLVQTSARDPITLVSIVGLLVVVTVAACITNRFRVPGSWVRVRVHGSRFTVHGSPGTTPKPSGALRCRVAAS